MHLRPCTFSTFIPCTLGMYRGWQMYVQCTYICTLYKSKATKTIWSTAWVMLFMFTAEIKSHKELWHAEYMPFREGVGVGLWTTWWHSRWLAMPSLYPIIMLTFKLQAKLISSYLREEFTCTVSKTEGPTWLQLFLHMGDIFIDFEKETSVYTVCGIPNENTIKPMLQQQMEQTL